jgi:hypothetical protein
MIFFSYRYLYIGFRWISDISKALTYVVRMGGV